MLAPGIAKTNASTPVRLIVKMFESGETVRFPARRHFSRLATMRARLSSRHEVRARIPFLVSVLATLRLERDRQRHRHASQKQASAAFGYWREKGAVKLTGAVVVAPTHSVLG